MTRTSTAFIRRLISRPDHEPLVSFGPDSVEVHPRSLQLGDEWCRTFVVTGYPREVNLGWLEPLANHAGRLDVAVHVEPVSAQVAAERLRRQLARLESGRRSDAAKGRLVDPEVEVATNDAHELAAGLARGEQRLFRVGLILTVHASDEAALTTECNRVRALASSLLLDAQPTTWRSVQGWVSTLPLGIDALGTRRSFDTAALAAAYPFASAELSATDGVLYGTAAKGAGLICWDRFACDNYNSVILARSGAGKSYLAKLEVLRSLYRGIEVAVVDPEDEYRRLAEAVGGAYVHLGASGVRINPFDLMPSNGSVDDDALVRQALFIHGLVAVLLGEPVDAATKPALDRAILAAYASVGITADTRTHQRPAPLLKDLASALRSDGDTAALALAARLEPFIVGSHRGLFDGPTTTRPEGHLVVFSLRDLPDELKAAGTLLTLQAIWRRVSDPSARRRRLVVVDEAWLLMREQEGARFLFRMAKSARKHWCGLTVVTQDAADLLGGPLGQAIVANAATQILLRQAPQAIDALASAFRLSDGERAFLLGARRGEGLLSSGPDRVAFAALASPTEHRWCTSDPAELADEEPELSSATAPTSVPNGPLAHYLEHPGATTGAVLRHLGHDLGVLGLHVGPFVVGIALVTSIGLTIVRRREATRMAEGARLVRVLAPPDVDPEGAATLWSNLVALLRPAWRRLLGGQPHLSFELCADSAGLTISIWVPGAVPPGLVERAVEAAWPGARTDTIPATPPLIAEGLVTGGELGLATAECYPIRTDHRVDPLRPLLGALAGAGDETSACVQLLARPVTGRRLAALQRAATKRRNGRATNHVAGLLDLVTPGSGSARRGAATTVDPTRGEDVAAILEKASQPCWAISLRYGVATTETNAAAGAQLRGRAHAIAAAFAIFAGRNRFDRHRLRHPADVLAMRRFGRGNLVSVRELAALAHLPTDDAVPGLRRAGAKAVAPPPEVAGLTDAPALGRASAPKLLGDAEGGSRRPVLLEVKDARQHLHVMGATGSGKSTLLLQLALGDIAAGRGIVVIDPKGDLITDLLARLPSGAEKRLVLIDPEEHEAPPILNVLSGPDPDLVVDNVVGIFRSIFEAYWGPRTDDVLRAACLTLLRSRRSAQASLADVPRLLADDRFRAPLVSAVADDAVGLGGFWSWYDSLGESSRAQVIGPVMNKLRAFLLRDFVRHVVGRPESSFDMGEILDGGICLVRIPKGVLGDETSKLLGSFVVAKVWQSATNRARLGQSARVDAALYIDECQNFLHLPRSFEEMLAEARGFGLSMVLAHQHLAQLPRDLRDAVSANARTKLWFSMSPEDAHASARHVAPELSEHDLSHLGAYQVAARLVVAGEETPAFTLRTRPPSTEREGRAAEVRSAARVAYGRPVERARRLVVATPPEAMAHRGGER